MLTLDVLLPWIFWLSDIHSYVAATGKEAWDLCDGVTWNQRAHIYIYIIKYDSSYLIVGIDKEYMAFHVWKNSLTIVFPSNNGHVRIYWYKAISAINPFKQPKHALELKLSNYKHFASFKIFICLPASLPTYLTTTINLSSILLAYSLHSFPV